MYNLFSNFSGIAPNHISRFVSLIIKYPSKSILDIHPNPYLQSIYPRRIIELLEKLSDLHVHEQTSTMDIKGKEKHPLSVTVLADSYRVCPQLTNTIFCMRISSFMRGICFLAKSLFKTGIEVLVII
jgi:hypothetical protein